ncbi:MAG: MFS transporter [Isosphaeraceae bacterium]|nr:MFS transporter [Isosphaeraceae bacterium]
MTWQSPRAERVAPAYLLLFASLYAIQGVVVAYFFNFNQLYMEAAGVAPTTIGWVQTMATLPLVFKFLGGPLSDRVNFFGFGHRRPYIILGLILQTLGLVGLTLIDPGRHLGGFATLALVAVTGLALYDTCCDGMAIDTTPPGDRARVQGILVASRFVATAICSWGFGHWLERTGTGPGRGDGVLWACAGLGLIPLVQTLGVREPRRAADAEAFDWRALCVLIRPRSLALLGFGALYATVAYGVEINLSLFYSHEGFRSDAIGDFASARYIGRAVGAALLPLGTAWLGRRGVLTIGVALLTASTAGQVLVGGRGSALFWGLAFGAANGWDDALFNVLSMEASDPRLAASTYALFMAVSNLSVTGGGIFASTVQAFGGRYRPVFLGSALIALASWLLTPPLWRPPAKPEPEPVDDLMA